MGQVLRRLIVFRRHLVTLWRAFWHPATPFYLKAIMLGVVAYLISPIDVVPDFIIGLGWIDDILLVTFAVNWIVKRLPSEVFEPAGPAPRSPDVNSSAESGGPTINGSARRL